MRQTVRFRVFRELGLGLPLSRSQYVLPTPLDVCDGFPWITRNSGSTSMSIRGLEYMQTTSRVEHPSRLDIIGAWLIA